MTSMRMLDPDAISIGYLLPTREAVTLGRPASAACELAVELT
jgi:hypothetical protein